MSVKRRKRKGRLQAEEEEEREGQGRMSVKGRERKSHLRVEEEEERCQGRVSGDAGGIQKESDSGESLILTFTPLTLGA